MTETGWRREVRWERMFPDELEEAFAACPLAYLAHGLCEPHGPQNAVGLDGLKAHAICCRAARAHGGIVAPVDMWHVHEIGGYAVWAHRWVGEPARSWLTSVPPWHHFKSVLYQIRQVDAMGFQGALLVTGHYGPNWQDLNDLVRLVQPHVGVRLQALPDFEANTPGFDGDGRSGGDHAGRVETSLLAALLPECTDLSRVPRDQVDQHPFAMGGDVLQSDRRVGERMVADEVRYLGAAGRGLLEAYQREQPTQRLRTFGQVERLWREVVWPELKDCRSMQAAWGEGDAVPEDSVWFANWAPPPEDEIR